MNTEEAIDILTKHNKWRRGDDQDSEIPEKGAMVDPKEIGLAIDYAIEVMKRGQWQDISTAPKDGTYVLVCEKDNSAIYEARFMWDDWFPAMQSDSDEYAPMKGFPSHWMPLPEPPQERKD